MEIHGLHHVTAVTAQAKKNVAFYTKVLGLRLVKKSVNQDDVSAYHLFYADKKGSPGTDMTFFDWDASPPRHGETDGILRTMFRVNGLAALEFWAERLAAHDLKHAGIQDMGNRKALFFEDIEGQRLALVDDQGAAFEGEVWDGSDVPLEHALRGFYAVQLAIPELLLIDGILTRGLGFAKGESYASLERPGEKVQVYSMEGGGPGKELHVVERQGAKMWALAGGVHHVAFRVKDEGELKAWRSLLDQVRLGNSGLVDRYYFESLYFRISDGILFELATDGPGFATDESAETLGEKLALPPFLEDRRAEIEGGLKPL
jgi:glyoxalase family protein